MPLEFAPVPGGVTPPPVGTLSLRGDHVNGEGLNCLPCA